MTPARDRDSNVAQSGGAKGADAGEAAERGHPDGVDDRAPYTSHSERLSGIDGEWFRSSDEVGQGFVQGLTFGRKPVTYSVVNGRRLFEGDIVLGRADDPSLDVPPGEPMAVSARGAIAHGIGITGEEFRWPGGRVPFEIDASVPQATRTVIANAIAHWHQNTNIRLVPRTAANAAQFPNFVRFIAADGCWSHVGMRGQMQEISIAAGCGFGAAVHEIGHAVGLWHEQSREDRAQHIRVRWENVQSGREHNFNQHITDGDDIGTYDFGSIMHYGATAFSKNGQPTIETINGQQIGQRNGLSAGDIAAVRALYPQLQPPPQTTRLFRYWNSTLGDHFYTTDWGELGGGRDGWVYERVSCYIHPAPATGSTPLFRYWNPTVTDHFYTTNWQELRAGRNGWTLESIAGYVYQTQAPGTIPLYRYWNPQRGDHFYTTSWAELGAGSAGWTFEWIQCYVYPQPPADMDDAALDATALGSRMPFGAPSPTAPLGFGSPGQAFAGSESGNGFGASGAFDRAPGSSGTFGTAPVADEQERRSGRALTLRIDLDSE